LPGIGDAGDRKGDPADPEFSGSFQAFRVGGHG